MLDLASIMVESCFQKQDADMTGKLDASQSQEKKSTPSQKGSASTTPIKKKKGGGKGQ